MNKMRGKEVWRRWKLKQEVQSFPFSKDEVREDFKRMKTGKTDGRDDKPLEVWKCQS